jgi:Ca2+/H+ antiporter, TMEM165/GDT1 family
MEEQNPSQHPSSMTQPMPEQAAASWGAVFVSTATTVFLAELGDKTQLAALLLSAQSGEPLVVFVGASLALVCSSLVGVVLGRWLARLLPAELLERLAGILMVVLGLWLGRQAMLTLPLFHAGLPGGA